jgi:hypothetical protein
MRLAASLEKPTMQLPSTIADYLDELRHELAFDPALSRRVRQEVEGHLRESAAAQPTEPTIDAEERAIISFGAPQRIAEQYRAVSLHTRMKRSGLVVLCAVLVAFGTMEGRVVWYGLTRSDTRANLTSVGRIVIPIDRYAFLVAIILGIVGAIIVNLPYPLSYGPPSRSQMRHGQLLIVAAAAATTLAVTCEVVLTSWRLVETHWTANSLLPVGSLMIEIGIVFAAVVYIRNTVRRFSAIIRHQSDAPDSSEAY